MRTSTSPTTSWRTSPNRIPDTWIPDTGYLDTGYRIPDTGYRIPDTGYRIPDTGYLDSPILVLVVAHLYALEHMFVLGIDPGLTTTGYGIVQAQGGQVRAVAVGVIRTDRKARIADRLLELQRDLTAVIAEHRPDEAAIEEVFVNRNLHSAIGVGRASGVVMVTLAAAGLRVAEYTPTAVKMALTGYGGADKEQIGKVIAMRLNLSAVPRPADAADALAVALCHVQGAGMRRAVEQAR
jgi:crossover junction endodeoxyribonuclease RuvC